MVNRTYPSELQLNKANVSDAEASILDLHLSISDSFVKTKIYDKRDDFDSDIVNCPCLDGDVPRSASYGVYISQLIRFARVSSHVDDFYTRNKVLTATLLRQGYRYHKLRQAFSKFYRRHFDKVSKYNVGLKTLLLQGLSEPEFYGDLVYKGLRALRPFFGPHLRSKYESGDKSISLHDFTRPIFLVFHFGFSLDLAVH